MHFNVYFNEILWYIFLIKLYETIYQSKLFLTLITHLFEFEVNAAVWYGKSSRALSNTLLTVNNRWGKLILRLRPLHTRLRFLIGY